MASARNVSRASALKNDFVGECVLKLHEKRRAAREDGMEALVAALEGFVVPVDEVDYRYFTVFDRCCASLHRRGGSAGEARLAYRAIGLLALTVGGSATGCSRDILEKALPVLEKTIQLTSPDAAAMVAALDCLAAVTFAGARRPEEAAPSMRAICGVIKLAGPGPGHEGKSTSPEVVTIAVSAWALLLATTCVSGTYQSAMKEAMIPLHDLARLLESDDRAVRMAAGKALAVCVESNLTQHASPEDMETLEIKVSDLAVDEKLAEEQALFRQIAAIISTHGECPDPEETTRSSSSSSGRGVLSASTWARQVQLNFLKRFLGKGFAKHVQDNPFFRLRLREEGSSVVTSDEADELPMRPKEWSVEFKKDRGKGWEKKQRRFWREKQWSVALRKDRAIGWEKKNNSVLIP